MCVWVGGGACDACVSGWGRASLASRSTGPTSLLRRPLMVCVGDPGRRLHAAQRPVNACVEWWSGAVSALDHQSRSIRGRGSVDKDTHVSRIAEEVDETLRTTSLIYALSESRFDRFGWIERGDGGSNASVSEFWGLWLDRKRHWVPHNRSRGAL